MIPFPFNENRFSFFIADHLLVGQLCTNSKSERSLLSCLKVSQCSKSKVGDAPLYNTRSLLIQVMTTGPLPALSKCKSGRFNAWRHSSTHRTTLRTATAMVFGMVSSEGHIMPPPIFEVCFKVNTKVYLDVLKSMVISWCNQVAGSRSWVWQQDSAPAHKSKEIQAYPSFTAPLFSRPEPAGLLRLVIRREHYQHDLPHFQSQSDRRHPPSIHRAPVGACGKVMLSVPDPYRGGDWGWGRLHWIDVSSTS